MTVKRFRFRHTMLPVADVERSVDFYTRLLGMSVLRRRDDAGRRQSTAYVGYGEEAEETVLELVAGSGKPMQWGGHISIAALDLATLCDRLDAEGIRFKVRLPAQGDAGRRMAVALDPDGFEVELTEL